ncbi:MAG: hypothetical protein QXN95_02770 [Candidatus Bathyarchaeia archaeon]
MKEKLAELNYLLKRLRELKKEEKDIEPETNFEDAVKTIEIVQKFL